MNLMNYAIEGYKDIRADKYIGIFGNPIKHTLSPVIHDTISRELGINEKYIPFHITESLGDAVNMAFNDGILGLNITVPYKQEVMQYLTEIEPAARAIGAVNTLVRLSDGYKGYNTDMPGLAKALFSEGVELKNSSIIMLGAGGAARAVAYMCLFYGAKRVYIVNRTYDNAKKIADDINDEFNCSVIIPVDASDYREIPKDKYIFIQCTSVGLHEGDGLPIVEDESFYGMAKVGVDLIYNPAKTPFLKLVEKLGGKAFNGLKMLLYQGVMAYELWNNVIVDDSLCEIVYNALCEAIYGKKNDVSSHVESTKNNIVLIGYMGAGKTAVGETLAKSYGYEFLDTDNYIVNKEGMSINDIFATKGEEYFRDLETKVVQELKNSLKNTVISTGGGLPIREENRKYLKELGKVVYLKASPDTTYKRLSGNTERPLLAGDNMYDKICTMLKERMPKYECASDIIIDTDNMSVVNIAKKIHDKIN